MCRDGAHELQGLFLANVYVKLNINNQCQEMSYQSERADSDSFRSIIAL